ncbi:hypothetical protein DNU06_03420 [Putridiphycobacter roseus]|uniref:Outer membrane protein beta-barrel domain-containing protein n=1 Tax=Putridiphycobacter roseus TaxID=2219161 RepID=A0A2W1N5L5_9FLAO|nr:hypothetical protein [Putridiphycobacter roseus]PZE18890.1 hypothetical protein DNU06_03420 [Putridiphycobacter roseus]
MIRILFLFILFNAFGLWGQSNKAYFGKRFEVGTSLTYFSDNGDQSGIYKYQEFSWNVNVKMSLSKRFSFGLQVIPILTKTYKGGLSKKEPFNFYGFFVQGNVLTVQNFNFLLETSFNQSNMLQNILGEPKTEEGIYYWGFGGSAELYSKKRWGFEIGFYNYQILNKIEYKSNYTQYILGVNYRIGKI